jgi:hypothetical protein
MTRLKRNFTLTRVTNLATGLAVIVMLVVLVITFKTLNNTDAQSRSDQLNGCRAEFRADIDAATATRADANDALSVLNAQIFAAALNRDPAVAELITRAELASRAVEAAAKMAKVANEAYAAAVTSSREHPDEFLNACKSIHSTATTETTVVPLGDNGATTTTTSVPAVSSSSSRLLQRPTSPTPAASRASSPTIVPQSPPTPAPAPADGSLLTQTVGEVCSVIPADPLCTVSAQ